MELLTKDVRKYADETDDVIKRYLALIIHSKVGVTNAITQSGILESLNRYGFEYKPGDMRSIRIVINEMREEGIPILGSSGIGYYLPASWDEVMDSTTTERAKARSAMITCRTIRKAARKYYPPQSKLF